MVIKQTLTTEIEEGGGLVGYLESLQDTAFEIAEEVSELISPLALDELTTPAPPVQYPIQWASVKQQRAFFATNGFGAGIPTQRTGKIRNSWISYVKKLDGKGFGFVIENTSPKSKFVYGSLAQDRTQALRFQQPFHANTGWQQGTDTVKFWLDAYDELYTEKLDARFQEFAKAKTTRRAFTSGKK